MTTYFGDLSHDPDVAASLERLAGVIAGYGPMVVACSGGVDSALLAYVAHRVHGEDMVCAIGISPSFSPLEEREAVAFLESHAIPYVRIATRELENPDYRANAPDRCFHCKSELFGRIDALLETAAFASFRCVAYGANRDDGLDHRPGARAATGHGVVAPLVDAEFDKARVRSAARSLGLAVWDKPASPCLSSRIPYHAEVTEEKLRQIDAAEAVLKGHGFRVCRVRHFGETARVELPLEDHERVRGAATWQSVVNGIVRAGFKRVELDPEGFRSGRLNDALAGGA